MAPPLPPAPGEAASWLWGVLGRVGAPLSSLRCWLWARGTPQLQCLAGWKGAGLGLSPYHGRLGSAAGGCRGGRDALGPHLGSFPCHVTQPGLGQRGEKGSRVPGCWGAEVLGPGSLAQQGVREGGHEGTAVLQPVGKGTVKPEVFSACFSPAQLQETENCSPGQAAPSLGQPKQQLPGQWGLEGEHPAREPRGCAGARAAIPAPHTSPGECHPVSPALPSFATHWLKTPSTGSLPAVDVRWLACQR